MANGDDIIIRGGSVDIDYDDSLYAKEGDSRSHKHPDKRIIRITIVDENGVTQYDSGEKEDSLKWEIKAHCR
jgi:hypothetical protein